MSLDFESFTSRVTEYVKTSRRKDQEIELVFVAANPKELAGFACKELGLPVGENGDAYLEMIDPSKIYLPGFLIKHFDVSIVPIGADRRDYAISGFYFVFKYIE